MYPPTRPDEDGETDIMLGMHALNARPNLKNLDHLSPLRVVVRESGVQSWSGARNAMVACCHGDQLSSRQSG